MERAKVLQEIRKMRFEEVYERQQAGRLSQEQAAEILNVDVRTVGRWMRRHEGDGLDGQIPQDTHRCHYVKASVRVHEYPDGTLAIFHGPRCLARYDSTGKQLKAKRKAAA